MKSNGTKLWGFVFLGFLLLGNLPRIFAVLPGLSNINSAEIVLYFFAFMFFIFWWRNFLIAPILIFYILVISFSISVGYVKWGWSQVAVIYSIRLIFQIIAGAVSGIWLYKIFRKDVNSLYRYIAIFYSFFAILAFALLLLFPESAVLWASLADVGVEFNGDPHEGRLVSFYFDPNFYSTIAVFPTLAAFYWGFFQKSKAGMICFLLLLVSILLTVSRSGIALFLFCAFTLMAPRMLRVITSARVKRAELILIGTSLVVGLFVIFISADVFLRLLTRVGDVRQDDSAGARLDSFLVGMELFYREQWLGFGYNYGLERAVALRELGIGLDSSLQVILVNFGLVLSLFVFFVTLYSFLRVRDRIKKCFCEATVAFRIFSVYFFFCIIWSSNFNQLIFYSFWLVPVLSISIYFIIAAHESRKDFIKSSGFGGKGV